MSAPATNDAAAAAGATDAAATTEPYVSPADRKTFKFNKIDLHTHILPENFPDLQKKYGYGDFIRLEHHCACKAKMFKGDKFFREIEDNCYRGEPRLRDCDEQGVTVQVLSTVPVMFSYWAKPQDTVDLCHILNQHISDMCVKYPKRFVGLATLPMQAPELAVAELERAMKLPGIVGIQIGTHINDWALSEPKLFPVFEAAQRLDASIFVHPWDMQGHALMEKYWLPWLVGMPAETSFAICSLIFGGVFERLPKLKVAFAHGGGSFPGTIGRIEWGFKCRPDLVACDNNVNPRDYLGRFWFDSLVHDEKQLACIVDLVGADKIICGSDYPFPLGELYPPGGLVEQDKLLDEQQKNQILWENGLKFLGLKAEDFEDITVPVEKK